MSSANLGLAFALYCSILYGLSQLRGNCGREVDFLWRRREIGGKLVKTAMGECSITSVEK